MNSSKIYKSIIYQTKETQTGTATILVNEGTGDNVIAIYPGANMTMSSDEITIQKEAIIKEGANKRGNSSRLTQSFHFFMFEPIFSPVNALNQPI